MATGMAQRMARVAWPRDVIEERSAIVPVPLGKSRFRERGYNQSAVLAEALGKIWHCTVQEDVIFRARETISQTELKPEERRANVAGAFTAPEAVRERIRGSHLIIIDDVMTTAATLNSCAAALYGAGARTLSYITFGRARAAGDRL